MQIFLQFLSVTVCNFMITQDPTCWICNGFNLYVYEIIITDFSIFIFLWVLIGDIKWMMVRGGDKNVYYAQSKPCFQQLYFHQKKKISPPPKKKWNGFLQVLHFPTMADMMVLIHKNKNHCKSFSQNGNWHHEECVKNLCESIVLEWHGLLCFANQQLKPAMVYKQIHWLFCVHLLVFGSFFYQWKKKICAHRKMSFLWFHPYVIPLWVNVVALMKRFFRGPLHSNCNFHSPNHASRTTTFFFHCECYRLSFYHVGLTKIFYFLLGNTKHRCWDASIFVH